MHDTPAIQKQSAVYRVAGSTDCFRIKSMLPPPAHPKARKNHSLKNRE